MSICFVKDFPDNWIHWLVLLIASFDKSQKNIMEQNSQQKLMNLPKNLLQFNI